MIEYAATHVVEDAKGGRFQLYEYRGKRVFTQIRDYKLETGERVKRINFETYEIAKTGERLARVE